MQRHQDWCQHRLAHRWLRVPKSCPPHWAHKSISSALPQSEQAGACSAQCCSDLPLLPSESLLQGSLGTSCCFPTPNVKVPNMFLLSNLQMFCVIFAAAFSGLSLCPPVFLPWIIESWQCACSIPVSGPKWE